MFVFKIANIIGTRELLEPTQLALQNFPGQVVMDDREIESFGLLLEKLERSQPDVVLLDLSQVRDSLEDAIKQIKSAASAPKVIIIHKNADPDTILRCLRAGADEFLYPPLEKDLRSALERMSSDRLKTKAGTRPRGKVLGLVSAKGGCGASLIAAHVAVELTEQTKLETLLADFDMEGGIQSFLMKTQSRYSLLDAANNIRRLDMSFWKALVSNGRPGLEIVSAPAASAPLHQIYRDPEDYRTIVRFARANYDWTVADFGHGLNYLLLSVLEELDNLYVITTLDVPALHQAKHVITGVLERGLPAHRLQIVLNRFTKRAEVTIEEVESMIGQPIYATLPDDPLAVSEALSEGKLVPVDSQLGAHTSRVVGKITGLETKKKKRFSLF